MVVAPAGAGKTLGVAGWLERRAREHDATWVRRRAHDHARRRSRRCSRRPGARPTGTPRLVVVDDAQLLPAGLLPPARRPARERSRVPAGAAAHPLGPGPLPAGARAPRPPDGAARRRAAAQRRGGRGAGGRARARRLPRDPRRDRRAGRRLVRRRSCSPPAPAPPHRTERPRPPLRGRRDRRSPTWWPARCSGARPRGAPPAALRGHRAGPDRRRRPAPHRRPAGGRRPRPAGVHRPPGHRASVAAGPDLRTRTTGGTASGSTRCCSRWPAVAWRPGGDDVDRAHASVLRATRLDLAHGRTAVAFRRLLALGEHDAAAEVLAEHGPRLLGQRGPDRCVDVFVRRAGVTRRASIPSTWSHDRLLPLVGR